MKQSLCDCWFIHHPSTTAFCLSVSLSSRSVDGLPLSPRPPWFPFGSDVLECARGSGSEFPRLPVRRQTGPFAEDERERTVY